METAGAAGPSSSGRGRWTRTDAVCARRRSRGSSRRRLGLTPERTRRVTRSTRTCKKSVSRTVSRSVLSGRRCGFSGRSARQKSVPDAAAAAGKDRSPPGLIPPTGRGAVVAAATAGTAVTTGAATGATTGARIAGIAVTTATTSGDGADAMRGHGGGIGTRGGRGGDGTTRRARRARTTGTVAGAGPLRAVANDRGSASRRRSLGRAESGLARR
mmetsp:Transcript_29912/g.83616  ORF Transcript_29912/g.83616 Transcript_29912/m.83616 type:complete len:215 (+) Transcript_29912:341-985(+)